MKTARPFRQMLPAAALVLLGTAALGAAALHPVRTAGVPVGILAPGDAGQTLRMIAAADGRVIATGGWMGAVFAASDDPDFADKLYRAGAMLVFRADRAIGCADLRTIERTS